MLRLDIAAADFNRVQLVLSNPPQQNFLPAGLCIEEPAFTGFDDWHRERPILVADDHSRASLCFIDLDAHLRSRLRGELFAFLAVARRLAGVDDVVAVRPQDFGQRGLVIFFGRVNQ